MMDKKDLEIVVTCLSAALSEVERATKLAPEDDLMIEVFEIGERLSVLITDLKGE